MDEQKGLLLISDEDSVAVALGELKAGESHMVAGKTLLLRDDIPFGHKAAVRRIAAGENVYKYGHVIGHAAVDISEGAHVHTHNLKTNLEGVVDYSYRPDGAAPAKFGPRLEAAFQGYPRKDGRAGVRNEVWIIPTVGCVNRTAKILEKQARESFGDRVEGIYAFPHNMGCSQLGEDHLRTQRLLKGLVSHPNAGAVLVLSLGCENNNLDEFIPALGDYDPERVKFLVAQEAEDEYAAGMELLDQLTRYAAQAKREPIPVEKLVVGFKCGGSDAFSGITANGLCGRVNDLIVRHGGSTILTEVPEMFGAETLLMERAASREAFDETVGLINGFKGYFTRHHQTIYENPSPGNKKGGISTLEEKSLGCIQKGGRAPVVGVLDYGQPVQKNGLNLLTGPGNDAVSCTNLVTSGAQLLLFTTGRGNPFGSPVPTIKIASNSRLYARKQHWIDFNAGQVLEGVSFDTAARQLFDFLLEVASGARTTKNEDFEYKDISLFRDGVIL